MADYTKTTWNTGDVIDATKINNLENQYDTAKSEFRNGNWTLLATMNANKQHINNIGLINSKVFFSSAYDTLQAAVDAAKGCTLVIDKDWTVGSTVSLLGSSYNYTNIVGLGEGVVTLTASAGLTDGVIRAATVNFQLSGITIDCNNQTSCVGVRIGDKPGESLYVGWQTNLKDMSIKNANTCLKLDGNTYYMMFDSVRMMDGNANCVHFNDDTDAVGDNGQTLFQNCEMAANYLCVYRTVGGATRHRIEFNRCGFYGAYGGAYQVDLLGVNGVLMNNCDFEESGTVTTAVVRAGGSATFIGCTWNFPTTAKPMITQTGVDGAFVIGGVLFLGCGFSAGPDSTIFDSITSPITCVGCGIGGYSTHEYRGKIYGSLASRKKVDWQGPYMRDRNRANCGDFLPHFKDDFFGRALDTTSVWAVSGTGGTATMQSALGGIVRLDTGASTNNTAIMNHNGIRQWGFGGSSPTWKFEALLTLNNAVEVEAVVGLRYDDTHRLVFKLDSGATAANWYTSCYSASETQADTAKQADTSQHCFMIMCYRNNVNTLYVIFYYDYQYVGQSSTNIDETNLMEPYIYLKTTDSNTSYADIDFVDITSYRG